MSINGTAAASTTTTSADGTRIAFEIHGTADAPAVIWVHGATVHRASSDTPAAFAERSGLRVLAFDRRGRGASGDTHPYEVQREIDDIAALAAVLDGHVAALIGESSGGVLALLAATAGVDTDVVVAYEPPFIVDGSRPPLPADYRARVEALAAAGDAEGAYRLFLTEAVGLPESFTTGITESPIWQHLAPVAPTLAYDARIMGDTMSGDPRALERFRDVPVPVLVGVGSATSPAIIAGAHAVVEVLPHGRLEVFDGGTHMTDLALVGESFAAFVRGAGR